MLLFLVQNSGHAQNVVGKASETGAACLGNASFEKTEPDYQCEVIVEYLSDNPEQFYLRSWEGTYFEYFGFGTSPHNVFVADSKSIQSSTVPFTLLDIGVKDTFVFRTPEGAFVQPLVLPDYNTQTDVLPVTAQSDSARIKVGEPVLHAVITKIKYNTDPSETTITELTPEIALSTMVRNDSTSDITETLAYSYLVSDVGTWTTTIGASVTKKASTKVEIPFLFEGEVEVSATVNASCAWGGSTTHTKTVTSSSTVAVPPMMKAVASILIRKSIIDIPFTYTKSIWYRSGGYEEVKKSGVYHNVESWNVDVQVDN
ncbi:hypothetical protein K443DRAFT_133567 [Laccaria amethystina LaAM-08-1]|uniref:Unplaced genomic scaffold K443scaffold_140, whole genome shotgun sequence n=1 Tax=Laccaria amethystina LaAM-08-1 TaxID=1095629 RepID=A0A0C9WMI0_9AGAR|nr:hypothetical protein K443DRAFT_133567 [Laccaria amethystina LaAM-08-1]